MTVFRPVEPTAERGATPREGPGRRPDKRPVGERFCQGEVGEAMWESPTVPGILDGDIHDEIPEM